MPAAPVSPHSDQCSAVALAFPGDTCHVTHIAWSPKLSTQLDRYADAEVGNSHLLQDLRRTVCEEDVMARLRANANCFFSALKGAWRRVGVKPGGVDRDTGCGASTAAPAGHFGLAHVFLCSHVVPGTPASSTVWVASVHLNVSSVPLALVTGLVHSPTPPPFSSLPSLLSLFARSLIRSVLSSGFLLPLLPTNLAPPFAPLGSVPILTSICQN